MMADKYVKLDDVIDILEDEWGYEGMREDLEKLPTADVVEVVRCKDCAYRFSPMEDDAHYCRLKHGLGGLVAEEDYCSLGKRELQKEAEWW